MGGIPQPRLLSLFDVGCSFAPLLSPSLPPPSPAAARKCGNAMPSSSLVSGVSPVRVNPWFPARWFGAMTLQRRLEAVCQRAPEFDRFRDVLDRTGAGLSALGPLRKLEPFFPCKLSSAPPGGNNSPICLGPSCAAVAAQAPPLGVLTKHTSRSPRLPPVMAHGVPLGTDSFPGRPPSPSMLFDRGLTPCEPSSFPTPLAAPPLSGVNKRGSSPLPLRIFFFFVRLLDLEVFFCGFPSLAELPTSGGLALYITRSLEALSTLRDTCSTAPLVVVALKLFLPPAPLQDQLTLGFLV